MQARRRARASARFARMRARGSGGRQVMVPRKKRTNKFRDKLIKRNFKTTLKYATVVSLDSAASSIVGHVFAANGMNDPDVTGTGHQSHGWDQHTAIYGRYRVEKSRMTVTPIGELTSAVVPALWGVYLDNDSTRNYATPIEAIEDMRTPKKFGLHNGFHSNADWANMKKNAIKISFNAKTFLDKDGQNESTIVTGDPSGDQNTAFFIIWAGAIGAVNPGSVDFLVEIEYDVVFTDPADVGQS